MMRNKTVFTIFIGLILLFSSTGIVSASATMQQRCDPGVNCILGEFVFTDDGNTPITTDNFCKITITNPNDTIVVNDVSMATSSDGWYYYTFSTSTPEGLYRSIVCCDTGANKRCLDKTFVLGTSLEGLPAKIWSYIGSALDTTGNAITKVWSYATRSLTSRQIATSTEYLAGVSTSTLVAQVASQADIATLAGYVDEVEGYIGVPSSTSTSTLFGAIKDVRTKLDQLDTLETKINTVDGIIDSIRASQLLGYNLKLSGAKEVLETKNYRAKLTILDYQSNPVNASSTPTIILYDALRAIATSTTMTATSTGVYEFVYTVPSGAANGVWETAVSVDLGGSVPVSINDYWEVASSPAQVAINSVSDATVPTISANVTISNEGSVGYEYKYEYCVVAQENNQCGGGDDVAYASAAKQLDAGQNWTTDLSLIVSDAGNYWFKVVVYWGTETSGAARTFTATEEAAAPTVTGGGAGYAANLNDIYAKLLEVQKELGYHGEPTTNIGASAYQTLKVVSGALKNVGGTKGYNLDQLYDVSSTDLLYLKNKSLEMKALLEVNKILIDKAANKPIITTWFEWGSVILKMLVINPSDSQTQTVPFRTYLPRETKPEYIIDKEDLSLDFDEEAGLWYVHKDIKLGPGQSVTKKVEIKDIWIIPQEEIDSLRKQFEDLIKPLEGTAYFAQAVTLKSDADRLLDGILRKQNEYKATPQDHILAFRENQESLKAVNTNLDALKKLVAEESSAGRAMGGLFGVSTTMTWAIIIIVVVGIAILMILLYTLLRRHQALQEFIAPGQKLKAPPMMPDLREGAIKIKGGFITYFLPPFGQPFVDVKKLIRMVVIIILAGALIVLFLLYRLYG